MYGIYANIGGIFMVNVTIYNIHGSYGCIYIYIFKLSGMIVVSFNDLQWLVSGNEWLIIATFGLRDYFDCHTRGDFQERTMFHV